MSRLRFLSRGLDDITQIDSMNTMRWLNWLALRLFLSLLLLPIFAAILLELLHRVFFREVYFQDIPILVLLWGMLFVLSNFAVSSVGLKRFQHLDNAGWTFLSSNNEYLLSEIFAQLQNLFEGGLLPLRRRRSLEDLFLRRYFEFFRRHVESKNHREKLLLCMKRDIQARKAFEALKTYLLQQPALTLELVDLAEQLMEFDPSDQALVRYMVEKYLQDRQVHYRAEYFYQQELQQQGAFQSEVVQLCLPGVLSKARMDEFAGWLYLRAWESGKGEDTPELAHQIYRTYQQLQTAQRTDALAQKLGAIVAQFPEKQVAQWKQEEQAAAERKLTTRLQRLLYLLQQRWYEVWGEIKRQRRYVYYATAGLAFVLVIYLMLPAGGGKTNKIAVDSAVSAAPGKKLFSLQVAATRNARAARREVNRLKKAGLEAYMLEPSGKSRWYRIRVGKYPNRQAAQNAGKTLRRKKLIREYFLVNYQAPKK